MTFPARLVFKTKRNMQPGASQERGCWLDALPTLFIFNFVLILHCTLCSGTRIRKGKGETENSATEFFFHALISAGFETKKPLLTSVY